MFLTEVMYSLESIKEELMKSKLNPVLISGVLIFATIIVIDRFIMRIPDTPYIIILLIVFFSIITGMVLSHRSRR